MKLISATLVCTVLNESAYIDRLIDSIATQSVMPNEIIIVDGKSTDNTQLVIENKINQYKNKLNIKLLTKKGNRSIGRNYGIKTAKNEIILITDSGCILDKNWVKNIIEPFKNKKTEVVAGYYKGKPSSIFEKCLVPFVLVMPNKVDPKEFLPATRSMAIKKNLWRKLKGFDEKLSHNEDYAFANKIKNLGIDIKFASNAIVYWLPRSSFRQSFRMFFRFAYGDIEAGLFRAKVLFTILRYIILVYLLSLVPIMKSVNLDLFISLGVITYIAWAIYKNYGYVNNIKAVVYLPLLQVTADIAVLSGSLGGFLKIYLPRVIKYFIQNKKLTTIILIYIATLLSMIGWGIPSNNHPFNYFMDEWHQAQSIRNLFTKGSPNIEGSANGSILQFYLSGLYLIPFVITHIINLFAIKSSVLNLSEQYKLFEVLRINTIIFGVSSISVFYYICKKYFKLPTLATILFVFNPAWIMLSNYFKYDIALMFWILLSILFYFRYANKQTFVDFLLAGLFSALALATKLSVEPLFLAYILLYFVFTKDWKKKINWLISGFILYLLIFIVFGIPDIVLGKGSLFEYLSSNLIRTPLDTATAFKLPINIWAFLAIYVYPSLFGIVFYFGLLISLAIIILTKIKEYLKVNNIKVFLMQNYALFIVIISLFLFVISLYPLKIGATNNRILVLIPFMAILTALGVSKVMDYKNMIYKYLSIGVIVILLLIQIFQTYGWVYLKIQKDPRQISSNWILRNIPKKSVIGIENIPIYQALPDAILKDYYLEQDTKNSIFKYNIINQSNIDYPKYVIISNSEIESKFMPESSKSQIVDKLYKSDYKVIATFTPDFKYVKLFTSPISYYLGAVVQAPLTIDIYEKK